MENKMNISFWLRQAKINSQGTMPVQVTITVNSQTLDFSSGVRCTLADWDDRKRRSKTCQNTNLRLNYIQSRFDALWAKLHYENEKLTVFQVRDYLQGIEISKKKKKLFDVYLEYIDRMKSFQGTEKEYSPETIRVWVNRMNVSKRFFAKTPEITLEEITPSMASQMEDYMLTVAKVGIEYGSRMVESLRCVLGYALDREYIDKNPLQNYRGRNAKKTEKTFLTLEEIETIRNFNFSRFPAVIPIRDVFVFLCYTGLLYSDYLQISQDNLFERNGKHWLKGQRKKGQNNGYGNFALPLHPTAIECLKSLENFKKPELATINKSLKFIALACGIEQNLCSRLGRNTFAYHALNTWLIEPTTVATMLGHASINTTLRYYAKIDISKIENDTKEWF